MIVSISYQKLTWFRFKQTIPFEDLTNGALLALTYIKDSSTFFLPALFLARLPFAKRLSITIS